jgi:predicted helicase
MLKSNIAIVVSKNSSAIGEDEFDAVSISCKPVELNFFRRGGEYIFPTHLYNATQSQSSENLAFTFRNYVDTRYDHHYAPEEILGYIYAILHAPAYRKRYVKFLRIDFPRIPFPESKRDFDTLSKLGWDMVQAHLLRKVPRLNLAGLNGKSNNEVERTRYSPLEKAVHFNKTQHFAPVPEDVWNFHIGGYQVLDKYLKSRKGRMLSLDEITHISAVADSLAFTIAQMAKIDTAYATAFPDRG